MCTGDSFSTLMFHENTMFWSFSLTFPTGFGGTLSGHPFFIEGKLAVLEYCSRSPWDIPTLDASVTEAS